METITYEEALKLFELPRDIGEYEGEPVQIGVGRYGPYVRVGEKFFVSIPKEEDPLELTRERALELVKAKQKEDAPVGTYKGKPITKGKGRFGPFLKYDGLFVNVPRKYDFENISLEDMHELIEKKVEKEANRYIHRWEDEKISVENGRWGPFIRYKKKNVKIPKVDGERMTPEAAKELTLQQVKDLIEAELPGTFKKKAAAKKKTTAKKKTATKKKATPASKKK
jgi:DNA topoisomerase-1